MLEMTIVKFEFVYVFLTLWGGGRCGSKWTCGLEVIGLIFIMREVLFPYPNSL